MSRFTTNFVFFFFSVSNFLLFISGVGMSALGIYIWTQTKRAGEFELIFLVLGIIIVLVSFLGFSARTSTTKLSCYSCILTIIFMVQLVVSVVGIILKDKVIEKAAEKTSDPDGANNFKKLIEENVDIAFYCTIAFVIIEFVCLIFTHCYKKAYNGLSEADKYRLLVDGKPRVDLSDVCESDNKKKEGEIHSKYDQKRKDLQEKYPEYYEKKNKKIGK